MEGDEALLQLLEYLKARDYRFVTVTPATHARVLARPIGARPNLRDVFGWNRAFCESDIEPDLLELMKAASILRPKGGRFTSALRVASLAGDLFFHSAYPTEEKDSVFFGPDTYRFTRFLGDRWPGHDVRRIVDMGAGSGAGGIVAARLAPGASVTLVDCNPEALRLARVNARAAGVEVELMQDDAMPPGADLVIANPPYIIDANRRSYRDGGDLFGGAVALEWAQQALERLESGGTMLLYTGAAIVAGACPLAEALRRSCAERGASLAVEEIDPDVFGEELEQPAYREVERIAAIGAAVRIGGEGREHS